MWVRDLRSAAMSNEPTEHRSRPQLIALIGGTLAFLVLWATPAGAHTGLGTHGLSDGLRHPFFGLDHLLAMVAVGVLASTARDRRIALATPVAFVTGMVGGGVLGIGGVKIPGIELAIALSVITLGVLIGSVHRHAGSWLPMLAVAFGVAHGHAHGAELPAHAIPVAYVLGFVGATVALHIAGTAVGLTMRNRPRVRTAAATLVSCAGVALLFSV